MCNKCPNIQYCDIDDMCEPATPRYILPDKPAVYAIYDCTRLIYIGSTRSLYNRFYSHKKTLMGLNYAHIKYSTSKKYGDWLMREVRLIDRLQPEGNKHGIR
jgi:excinuclease UvrABC nuclease subunit